MMEYMDEQEVLEIAENSDSMEQEIPLEVYYEEQIQSARENGNLDAEKYYTSKAEALKNELASRSQVSFTGYYAGRTTNEWREKAKQELVANGETTTYKKYCDYAAKAANG